MANSTNGSVCAVCQHAGLGGVHAGRNDRQDRRRKPICSADCAARLDQARRVKADER